MKCQLNWLAKLCVCSLFLSASACSHRKPEGEHREKSSSQNSYSRSSHQKHYVSDDMSYVEEDNYEEEDETYNEYEDEFSDGTHAATVQYYNSNTGTHSTYDLEVEVEDGEVTRIYFPNGGYLGQHHYTSSSELDESGEAIITTDENDNVEYTVTIED